VTLIAPNCYLYVNKVLQMHFQCELHFKNSSVSENTVLKIRHLTHNAAHGKNRGHPRGSCSRCVLGLRDQSWAGSLLSTGLEQWLSHIVQRTDTRLYSDICGKYYDCLIYDHMLR